MTHINVLEKLDKWVMSHKANCFDLSIDDGYEAACYRIKLYSKGSKFLWACESACSEKELIENGFEYEKILENKEDGYQAFLLETMASKKTLWVSEYGTHGWCGLEKLIFAALEAWEKMYGKIDKKTKS